MMQKSTYEPVNVQVHQVAPTGVLCQSGEITASVNSYTGIAL